MRFEDKVTVVTGGGSGLGRVLAHQFAAEGAAVVVADIARGRAVTVAEEIFDAGGYSLAQTTDVADASEVGAMVEATREAFGPVDVLINNAAKATDADFLSLGEMTWDSDVATTLKGAFLCSQGGARVRGHSQHKLGERPGLLWQRGLQRGQSRHPQPDEKPRRPLRTLRYTRQRHRPRYLENASLGAAQEGEPRGFRAPQ
jgi:NAD(P)-dependent dehydrogenase (short-subunit alcohol dehydrogenase family)